VTTGGHCIKIINKGRILIEVIIMAKAGMRRPDPKEPHGTESNHKLHMPKNDVSPVPEIQGKAKSGKEKAKPIKH
jgi:hypothetical protein